MDWALLFEVLLTVIRNCLENDPEPAPSTGGTARERLCKRLCNPGIGIYFGIARSLRGQGLHGKQLREAAREVMGELKAATPDEIEDLLDMAEEDPIA